MDHTSRAVAIFDKLANVYQERFMDVSLYHDTLDIFCSNLAKEGASVLELACGPGNITKYLLDQRPDLKITGTDLAPNMLALAAANNPQATFRLMDCRAIAKLDEQYDGIMCGFCLPYLSKEEAMQLIGDAARLLVPGGIIYISTMEDSYAKSGLQRNSYGDELFMYYHEAGYLSDALEAHGFNILKLQLQDYPTNTGAKVTDMILIGEKRNFY